MLEIAESIRALHKFLAYHGHGWRPSNNQQEEIEHVSKRQILSLGDKLCEYCPKQFVLDEL